MGQEIIATCECGKVKFSASDEPVLQVCCHCSDCRDATGDPFSTIAFFKTKGAKLSGSLVKNEYVAASGNNTARAKCPQCDTFMFDSSEGFIGLIGVFTQNIAPPFQASPSCHVWVASKLATTELSDGLACHSAGLA